ncbi:hypothetical protein AAT19DRAFT_15141 [Rhodotorula toruloides]|uniref:Cation-transporting P-type ATPase N-terminal domain-containing protein n=1 Tax=Rhodotorula toruloides TaxID=5286 RepID=A0A2T0A6C9_RHOTO|nr:hypothetical protein AAT19DRAFT_15141 [Rhodotorula toruloides]
MAALAHTQTADSLAQQLHVALDKGLTASQVEKNQCKYGKNVLPEEPLPPLWELTLE